MNLVAAKCEACAGSGQMIVHMAEKPEDDILGLCLICSGSGYERPARQSDTEARNHVEGEKGK